MIKSCKYQTVIGIYDTLVVAVATLVVNISLMPYSAMLFRQMMIVILIYIAAD